MSSPSETPSSERHATRGLARSIASVASRWLRLSALGCVGAALWGVVDGVVSLARSASPSPLTALVVLLQLVALYAPLGLVFGAVSTLLTAWVTRVPSWASALVPLRRPRRLVEVDVPRVVALLAELLLLGTAMVGTTLLAIDFGRRFHRVDLAAALLGGLVVLYLVLLPGLRALVRGILTLLLPRRGPLVTLAFWGVVFASLLVSALVLTRHAELWQAYRPLDVAWLPIGLGLVALAALALGRRLAAAARAQAALVLGSLALLLISAWTYDALEPARSTIESRSILGRALVSRYAQLTDRDGDGYAWAFGGGDCDDSDPRIHPGASDPSGDGIDSDCFAGDGAPDVAPQGDGAMRAHVPGTPWNVLLITVDTLHRGHLGVNGYARSTSPHIDAFAQTATQYAEVLPQSSRSVLSIPAMLIGNYASEIARGDQSFWPEILPENTTFAEALGGAGYRTEAYIGTNYFTRLRGFYQGFDEVRESSQLRSPRREPADQSIAALTRLAQSERPFLVWTHLMNVHQPYLEDGVPSRFGASPIDRYDTEVALADQQVGRLLDALDELGLADRTAVILASDHGEAFGDHAGVHFHATSLYEDQLASMLFLRVPGLTRPNTRVTSPVGLLDVMPTVLNLAGVSAPTPISGRSLLGCLEGCDDDRPIFAELIPEGPFPADLRKVRRGDRTVLWDLQRNAFQAFDLARDPLERVDVSDEPASRELRDLLRMWVAHESRNAVRGDAYVERFRVTEIPRSARWVGLYYPDRLGIEACETPTRTVQVGETFHVTCYLRALAEMRDDLKIVVWFVGPTAPPSDFHGIHVPLNGRYHTNQWRSGELLRDVVGVVVPPDIQVPSRWEIHVAVDTLAGVRQRGELGGRPTLSTRIGTLEIGPVGARITREGASDAGPGRVGEGDAGAEPTR